MFLNKITDVLNSLDNVVKESLDGNLLLYNKLSFYFKISFMNE